MAAKGILRCVLRRIAAVDENLASAIKGRFDDAANLGEKMTLALGEAAPSRRSRHSGPSNDCVVGTLGEHDRTE
jgi:hypothetical protein